MKVSELVEVLQDMDGEETVVILDSLGNIVSSVYLVISPQVTLQWTGRHAVSLLPKEVNLCH